MCLQSTVFRLNPLLRTSVAMAQWFIQLDKDEFRKMTEWEEHFFEKAAREYKNVVQYSWPPQGQVEEGKAEKTWEYEVDLSFMTQTNLTTGTCRPLYRLTAQWFVQLNDGNFHRMTPWEEHFFEKAARENKDVVQYSWPPQGQVEEGKEEKTWEYKVDLRSMTQTNVRTGVRRRLFRLTANRNHTITSPFSIEA